MPRACADKSEQTANQRAPRKDKVLAAATELAREALLPIAKVAEIGEHLGFQMDAELLGTHYFECVKPGYRGWRWATTIARVPRGRKATVCEVALVPGAGALLAPAWIPWAQRLRPTDVSPGDAVPYLGDDERLEDAPAGSGRRRQLSHAGREQAAQRWLKQCNDRDGSGRRRRSARVHGPSCGDCGFFLPLPLFGQAQPGAGAGASGAGAEDARSDKKADGALVRGGHLGVCANEWSAQDGRVVSIEYSCGAHSETDVQASESLWPNAKPHMDEHAIEVVVDETGSN